MVSTKGMKIDLAKIQGSGPSKGKMNWCDGGNRKRYIGAQQSPPIAFMVSPDSGELQQSRS